MNHSKFVGNPTFRKFVGEKKIYYVPTETVNAADNVQVDTHNPDSRGYGGTTFEIKTTEGVDHVKGPWHGTVPYEVCDVTELHFTQVTLIANAKSISWDERAKCDRDSTEFKFLVSGDVLYDEKEKVLGTFYRGDRIAQQLADLRQEAIFVHVETNGGSHSHTCNPGDTLHPNARRTNRNPNYDLSTEQGMIVDG